VIDLESKGPAPENEVHSQEFGLTGLFGLFGLFRWFGLDGLDRLERLFGLDRLFR
jgi:hypothetical protein